MEMDAEGIAEVARYFLANPKTHAARVKPEVARAGAGWQIFFGPELGCASVFGWTLASAFERWEANYNEAVRAQQ